MTRINELPSRLCSVVEGQYLLACVTERLTRRGDYFKILKLVDATGELCVYAWEESGLLDEIPFCTPQPVQARLHVRRFEGQVVADLRAVYALDDHEIDNAAALLPLEDCPAAAHEALAALVAFNAQIEPIELRCFVNRVLADPRISPALLTCKGSQAHHHAQPGGVCWCIAWTWWPWWRSGRRGD